MTRLTDEVKRFVSDNYWSVWLAVEAEERVKCGRCGRVAFDHRLATCLHVFCFKCIVHLDHKTKCFKCGNIITLTSSSDKEVDKRICQLKVHCTNYKHGCNVITKLYQIQEHLKVCKNNKKNVEYFEISSSIIKIDDDVTKFKNEANAKFQEQSGILQTIVTKTKEVLKKIDITNNNISNVKTNLEEKISKIDFQEIYTKIDQQTKDFEVFFTECRNQKKSAAEIAPIEKIKELNVVLWGKNGSSWVSSLSPDPTQMTTTKKNNHEIVIKNHKLRIFNCEFNLKNLRKTFNRIEQIHSVVLVFSREELELKKSPLAPQIFSEIHRDFAPNVSFVITNSSEKPAEITQNLRGLLNNYSELIKIEEEINVFFFSEKNAEKEAQKFLDFLSELVPCSTEDSVELMSLDAAAKDVAMILDHVTDKINAVKSTLDFRRLVSDEDLVVKLNAEKKLLIKTLKIIKKFILKNCISRNSTKKTPEAEVEEDLDSSFKKLTMMDIYGEKCRDFLRRESSIKNPIEIEQIAKNAQKNAQKKCVTIALLGETGTGKSTLINAFANYSRFSSYAQARSQPEVCPIPTKFTFSDEDYNETVVQRGPLDLNESMLVGQLGTLATKSYRFALDQRTDIRWIDTSGFGSSHGPAWDAGTKRDFLSFVLELEELETVAIVANGDQARDSERFRYSLQEVLSLFHKSAKPNFVLIFTHGNAPKDGVQTLQNSVKALKMENAFRKNNTFFFENDVFRSLMAEEEPEVGLEAEWKANADEFSRLVRYVSEVKRSHDFRSTARLNEVRSLLKNVNLMLDFLKKPKLDFTGSGIDLSGSRANVSGSRVDLSRSEERAYLATATKCAKYIRNNCVLYENLALREHAKHFKGYHVVDTQRHLEEADEEPDVVGYDEVWESVKQLVLAETTGSKFERLLGIEEKIQNKRKSTSVRNREEIVSEENAIFLQI